MIKKFFWYLKIGLIAIGVLLATYLITAFTLSIISTNPSHSECQKGNEIYIASNGVHLDLIIPRKYLPEGLADELDLPQLVNFIAFGWGDKEFYINTPTWNDLKFDTSFKALFLESKSAIHITWINQEYQSWTVVALCDIQLQLLIEYLEETFKKSPGNNILEIEASGYTDYDKFYEAFGSFNCFRTCNNWVNNALKAAQVKTSIWSPFDQGVLYQAKKNAQKWQ